MNIPRRKIIKAERCNLGYLCQGDIIKDVDYCFYSFDTDTKRKVEEIHFPYIVVVSQECDLMQDYYDRQNQPSIFQDKHLISILVLPCYNSEIFFRGEHLSEIGLKMKSKSSEERKRIKSNQDKRYHYLRFGEEINLIDLVIDFKHYITVNIDYLIKLKKNNYVCTIKESFKDEISQRFSSYLSRIGTPEIYQIEKDKILAIKKLS